MKGLIIIALVLYAASTQPLPVLYTTWQSGIISPFRENFLQSIRANSGLEVVYLTLDNITDIILPDHPLHPAYPYLTATQKADYLKAYLMNFYGGGYADIKLMQNSWVSAARKLQEDDNLWAVGYR